MTLDDNHPAGELLEKPVEDLTEPEWRRIARAQEAAEARSRAAESRELLASETPEAEEARWSYRFARSAVEIPTVHYADGTSS